MGYMLDFVVDLVEERVDLGGSQFSESILERWYSARASQRNVVVMEFGSPCPPRVDSEVFFFFIDKLSRTPYHGSESS